MANKFPNLPGIIIDYQDGNLPIPLVAIGKITLVLGTSGTGIANKLLLVTDASAVSSTFGKSGTLSRGMVEVLEGGANAVGLYRIGATPAKATGVAHGNAADTGFTISTADADGSAGEGISVSYDADNGILHLYDVATGAMVYSDDPANPFTLNRAFVTGSAAGTAGDIGMREDTGLNVTVALKTVVIAGEDVTAYYHQNDMIDVTSSSTTDKANEGKYRIGSVVFSTDTTITFNAKVGTPGWTGWDHSETGAITLRHDVPVTLESIGQDSITPESFSGTIATDTLTSASLISDGLADTDLLWIEMSDASETGFYYVKGAPVANTFKLALTSGGSTINSYTSTTFTAYDAAKVATPNFTIHENLSVNGTSPTKLFVGQRVYIYTDVISERGYYYVKAVSDVASSVITVTSTSDTSGTAAAFTSTKARIFDLVSWDYIIGDDGLGTDGAGLTYRALYEALEKAYWELEAAQVDYVVPMGAFHNVPNVADDNLLTYGDNALLYLKTAEVDGELTFTWLDQTDLDALASSEPDEAATYHEVSFSYQLARFCANIDKNEHPCKGFIGVLPPAGFSKGQLSTWYGTLPTYDVDGNILSDGTGLLGDKFMVGSQTHNQGFFATDTEELDGTVLYDSNNKPVDIGKFLSVTGTPVVLRNSFLGGAGYITTFASTYAGLVAKLAVGVSPTNQITRTSCAAAFQLHKSVLNSLVGAKYITLKIDNNGNTVVIDAPTAAHNASDFRRFVTMEVMADVITEVRNTCQPALGKVTNAGGLDALQAQINKKIGDRVSIGTLNQGSFAQLTATKAMLNQGKAKCKLVLNIPGELRNIETEVALSQS